MKTIIYFILLILAVALCVYLYRKAQQLKKEIAELEKKQVADYEEMQKANEIKENANSGNIGNDINFMADELHKRAKK